MADVGQVTDWFGYTSSTLAPISSTSGDNRQRICVCNAVRSTSTGNQSSAGRYSSGVSVVSNIWRNPSVTYRILGSMTFAINLGTAYPANGTISGYMITSVDVKTTVGEFPTVTVSAVANEGSAAINLFAMSIPIAASAHAQNLINCWNTNGAILQSCELKAECEPVVCAENNFPCASDVVRGRYVATAEFICETASDIPTVSSDGGFSLVDFPTATTDAALLNYRLKALKEIT